MLPNTALNLQESRRNVLKDFVQVAGPLGVTHFIMLSSTDANHYLKVARTPRGPTLSLRILSYSLMRDVQSAQARPRVPPNAFKTPPLVVLNGFAGQQHLQLFTTMFQSMFPSINVAKVRLAACQRVVLLALDKATGVIRLRHYTISLAPSGLRKGLKGLLQRSSLPDMSSMQDVAEFMTRGGYGSESEGEEAEASRVTLGQDLGKGNAAGRASRVRLHEVGPRLELQLMKVEEGLCSGAVLYHALVAKTAEEAAALAAKHEEQAALKEVRRRKQVGVGEVAIGARGRVGGGRAAQGSVWR
ncbi:Brix domain-containing protein [Haematococcus lacustris]